MRRAVVDVGSNSVLLTVAKLEEGDWRTLLETSTVTALGEGVRETGAIAPERAEATLAALRKASSCAIEQGAEMRAYGTMALRIADNAQDFLAAAEAQGTPVQVISGQMEADLGLTSVVADPTFSDNPAIGVVDVGGHSTEISIRRVGGDITRTSFPVGTLGLRSQFLTDEAPPQAAILKASAALDDAFGSHELSGGIIVGLGASVTNLASIREALVKWDPDRVHGAYLTYEEVSRFVGHSMRMSDAERAAIVGLEAGRERTVHIGALIVERALLALASEGIFVSVRGWRHAMLSRWL